MKAANSDGDSEGDRAGDGLLAGTILAALLALVFGACFFTVLDATRPVGPSVAVSGPSGKQAAMIKAASF
jgi:hypothetical protein